MKKSKIVSLIAAGALTLAMGAFALTGCAKGVDYTFEAESAVLNDPATVEAANTMKLQTSTDWTQTGEGGDEVVVVSYFSTPGQTITWTINSASECDATLKLVGSSCSFGFKDTNGIFCPMALAWSNPTEGFTFDENTKCHIGALKGEDSGTTLKVNGTAATLTGALPETAFDVGMDGMMNMFSTVHIGSMEAKIHLKSGENVIVLESVTGGFNVDKIVINSKAELTFTATDNSDRAV